VPLPPGSVKHSVSANGCRRTVTIPDRESGHVTTVHFDRLHARASAGHINPPYTEDIEKLSRLRKRWPGLKVRADARASPRCAHRDVLHKSVDVDCEDWPAIVQRHALCAQRILQCGLSRKCGSH
jgi:hypothetical protein